MILWYIRVGLVISPLFSEWDTDAAELRLLNRWLGFLSSPLLRQSIGIALSCRTLGIVA